MQLRGLRRDGPPFEQPQRCGQSRTRQARAQRHQLHHAAWHLRRRAENPGQGLRQLQAGAAQTHCLAELCRHLVRPAFVAEGQGVRTGWAGAGHQVRRQRAEGRTQQFGVALDGRGPHRVGQQGHAQTERGPKQQGAACTRGHASMVAQRQTLQVMAQAPADAHGIAAFPNGAAIGQLLRCPHPLPPAL